MIYLFFCKGRCQFIGFCLSLHYTNIFEYVNKTLSKRVILKIMFFTDVPQNKSLAENIFAPTPDEVRSISY